MRKQKKFLIQIIIFIVILLSGYKVAARDVSSYLNELQFSEDFLSYLELSEAERENVIMPRMYDISKTTALVTNPLRMVRMLGSTIDTDYTLLDIIEENLVIKNQFSTNTCWAFSSLAMLETTLALNDYKNGITTPIVYDFSERHLEYATSETFLDTTNANGFNREVGDGGNLYVYIPYLTNGTGVISEDQMEFENNEDKIYISEIQDKQVVTQVNDIVMFPSYNVTDDLTKIKQQMKDHIKNYGAIDVAIHGESILGSNCYNPETGALYCDNKILYPINHAVTIIGWDDTYSKENFLEDYEPLNDGAWIVKNSWGKSFGNDGFMYVSYEDVNVYRQMTGIENAQSEITYENIYQYDQYGGYLPVKVSSSKVYLATIFNKKTTLSEYLTQVSVLAPETYTCKVYVNPNGTSTLMEDLKEPVKLKAGESETFNAGYHTIEFAEPLKINSDEFVVVLEIQGTSDSVSVMMEFNFAEFVGNNPVYSKYTAHIYDNVTVESGKCFWAVDENGSIGEWVDASTSYKMTNGGCPNFDTTIKAFTTSNILESIEIIQPSTKIEYVEGQDFDTTGMIVMAQYGNGKSIEIKDYTIQDEFDLQLGQTEVTILYEGKTATQTISVIENKLESIEIKNAPDKTKYWQGENFDATGMLVEATYTDGTKVEIADYKIQDGANLKKEQTTITVEYEDKIAIQEVTVKENTIIGLEIVQKPNKLIYVVGQTFNSTGMIVQATYANENIVPVTTYNIQNGTNLQIGQTTVIIEFDGLTTTQAIKVEDKTVNEISIKKKPIKTEYIYGQDELDLMGGIIEITYNNWTTEQISMTSLDVIASGFNNNQLGKQTITLTYQGFSVQFDVEVKELQKPVNSDFDNMQGKVTNIKGYYFTDVTQKGYVLLSIELNNIVKSTENDSMEYYYYLSTNPEETNIKDWIKIDLMESVDNKISYEINTLNVANYEELVDANTIYLYIKEVATKNDTTSEVVTSSIGLDVKKIIIEEYIDGEKVADVSSEVIVDSTPSEKVDNTLSKQTIPNAGEEILIICLTLAIVVVGVVVFVIYKDIEIK